MDDALRDGVIDIARRAAAAILAVYDSASFEKDAAVQHKDDRSPLTAADLAAHRCIVEGLRALTPDIPVLSEESRDADIARRRAWTRRPGAGAPRLRVVGARPANSSSATANSPSTSP